MGIFGKTTTGAALAALCLAGCATTGDRGGDGQSISIPYDPYNYDPDEMYQEAQAHCGAYGLNAVYVDETVDPTSVRWRYRHFDCV
ncbi:MAG: hypothetical protein AAGC56_01070 [Pseudomonadota bacterium]